MAEGAARRGDRVAAHRLLEEAVAHFGQLSGPWGAVRARLELARLDADGTDVEAAHNCLADVLSLCRAMDDRSGIAAGLEVGAALAASANDDERAARLAGGAEGLRETVQVLAAPREKTWLSHRLDAARRRLGAARYGRAYEQGRALSLEAAVELALQHAKSTAGVNLTAREREIALLVARGWTDGQIAQHLVIGRRTVESHVGHILAKLGFDSRAQIAAWATAVRVQHP